MKIFCILSVTLLVDLVIHGAVDAVSQKVTTDELAKHLFENYDPYLRPNCPGEPTVKMVFDLALRQIMGMNEREQILTTNIWVRTRWNDCRLKWNPEEFQNITTFAVTYNELWTPDLTQYDSAADEKMMPGRPDYRAKISNTGIVNYNFPTVIKSICKVNVRYFPFDRQECYLKFGSWSHHGDEVDISNKNPYGDLDVYVVNSEWIIQDLPAKKSILYYNCCPEPYPDVTYYIKMKRRPSFYLLTMVFPCLITSAVSTIGFILPAESGERVCLNITVLLSMAVFLLVVSESLPPSSDNLPIIGIYFATCMFLVCASCLLTVVIMNVFYRGTNGRKVPRILKIIFFHHLGRYLGVLHTDVADEDEEYEQLNEVNSRIKFDLPDAANVDVKKKHSASHCDYGSSPQTPLHIQLRVSNNYMSHIDSLVHEKRRYDHINSEWKDLANIIDRIFLIVYLVVFTVTTLTLLLRCVYY